MMLEPVRLTIACALLLSVAVVIGADIFLVNLRNRAFTESERNLTSATSILAHHIEQTITAIEDAQKNISAQISALGIIDKKGFEDHLSSHDFHLKLRDNAAGLVHVGSLSVFNQEGRLINFSRQWPIPKIDVSDREFFRTLQANQELLVFLGEPVRNRATGTWVAHYVRKIEGPNNEFLGLLTAAIELQSLQHDFNRIALESANGIVLFREDGALLARAPKTDVEIGRRFPNAFALKLVVDAERRVDLGSGVISNEFRMYAAQRITGLPLVVATSKPVTMILASWQRTTAYVIGISALCIAAIVAFAILFLNSLRNQQALAAAQAEQEKTEKLHQQNLQFNLAVNNMPLGVLMFDASARLVVCNERYIRMFGLSSEIVQPGLSFLDLIKHRVETGSFNGDPHEYCSQILSQISQHKSAAQLIETAHGRWIHIINRPMAHGGWVATLEDVTAKVRAEIGLRKSKESFSNLFEYSPDARILCDNNGTIKLANNEAHKIFAYGPGGLIGQCIDVLLPEATRKEHARLRNRYLKNPKRRPIAGMQTEIKGLRTDGSLFPAQVSISPLDFGGEKMICATVRDVTKAKLAEEEIRRTKTFLDMIVENVPLPILVKEAPNTEMDVSDCRYTLANRAFEEMMGLSRCEVVGKTTYELYPKERADQIIAHDRKAALSHQALSVAEHSLVTRKNGTRLVTAKKVAIRDRHENPQYMLTVLDDVTERRRTEERIRYLAHNDTLTALPNRAKFIEHFSAALDEASKAGKQFAILSIDLDHFKDANDVYGHVIGDILLAEAARRLKGAAGEAFIARVGGDEFMLISTDGSQPVNVTAIADRMLASFKDHFEVDGHRIKLGLSIGGAIYPIDGTDVKLLMANVDIALYRAKAETRGSVRFFEQAMAERLHERNRLESDLRSAVGCGELLLHYQPQEKMSGDTVGFEALVRWQSPTRGLVSPSVFIPIAEESNLIVSIGEWVIREACREAASWPQALTIAVNISPTQFRHSDLPGFVHSVLLETGLAPARLELEITEGVLIDDFSRAVSILRRLKALGVKIAMDDFGTGYSSMSYLHAFPFDKIKIDRVFVDDLEHNRHSQAIVRAIIGLGNTLNIPILAEGVETTAQHAFLLEAGCDEVQGYLTGRPLPIENYASVFVCSETLDYLERQRANATSRVS